MKLMIRNLSRCFPRGCRVRLLFPAALAFVAMAAAPAMAQTVSSEDTVGLASGAPAADVPAESTPVAAAPVHAFLGAVSPSAPSRSASPDINDANDDEAWHFNFALYGFLSSINGELRAGD